MSFLRPWPTRTDSIIPVRTHSYTVEIGTLMFGGDDPVTHQPRFAALELLRLAIPRRVYTQSHIDYVVEAILKVNENKQDIRGLKIVEQAPFLRHFTAKFDVAPREAAEATPSP